jgi:hypothetical protein
MLTRLTPPEQWWAERAFKTDSACQAVPRGAIFGPGTDTPHAGVIAERENPTKLLFWRDVLVAGEDLNL